MSNTAARPAVHVVATPPSDSAATGSVVDGGTEPAVADVDETRKVVVDVVEEDDDDTTVDPIVETRSVSTSAMRPETT